MKERFVVGFVGGWPITAATIANGRRSHRKEAFVWYVWDSAYCYEIVAEFRDRGHGSRWGRPVTRISGEAQARALAKRLNAEEAACLQR